jgi:hypothetical protein
VPDFVREHGARTTDGGHALGTRERLHAIPPDVGDAADAGGGNEGAAEVVPPAPVAR